MLKCLFPLNFDFEFTPCNSLTVRSERETILSVRKANLKKSSRMFPHRSTLSVLQGKSKFSPTPLASEPEIRSSLFVERKHKDQK